MSITWRDGSGAWKFGASPRATGNTGIISTWTLRVRKLPELLRSPARLSSFISRLSSPAELPPGRVSCPEVEEMSVCWESSEFKGLVSIETEE